MPCPVHTSPIAPQLPSRERLRSFALHRTCSASFVRLLPVADSALKGGDFRVHAKPTPVSFYCRAIVREGRACWPRERYVRKIRNWPWLARYALLTSSFR